MKKDVGIPRSPPGMIHAYDDFTLNFNGNPYVAMHPNEIVGSCRRVARAHTLGGNDNTISKSPTSAAIT